MVVNFETYLCQQKEDEEETKKRTSYLLED